MRRSENDNTPQNSIVEPNRTRHTTTMKHFAPLSTELGQFFETL